MDAQGKRRASGPVTRQCGLLDRSRRDVFRCQSAAEAGLPVCRGCHERVRRVLTELPALYRHCESLLVRFPSAFVERRAGRTAATGLTLPEPVTNVRRDMVAVLASWCALVADERNVRRPGRRDAGGLCAFLAIHVDWLLAHPAGLSFAEELTEVAVAARQAANSAPVPNIELGQCVEDGCDHPMTVTRPTGGAPSSLEVRCAAGHAWQTRQWLQLAREVRGRAGAVA